MEKPEPNRASLHNLIDKQSLLLLAGITIYQRGAHYQQLGAVLDLCNHHHNLTATVAGSDYKEYQVQLWNAEGKLASACSCPMGQRSVPCKHVVAAGLAWLHQQDKSQPGRWG